MTAWSWELTVLALLTLLCLVLALIPAYPPMNDASSHLATAVIAERLMAGDEFFRAHYAFEPTPLPYWSVTLVLALLLQALDPLAALDVLLGLYCVGLPVSWWCLLKIARVESPVMALAAPLVLFNWAFWLGELNFLIGQPLLLVALALFMGLERVRSWRFAAFAGTALLVYLSHLFALVGLLVAVGCLLVRERLRRPGAEAGQPCVRAHYLAGVYCALLFALAAWLVLFGHGTAANRGQLVFDISPYRLAQVAELPIETTSWGTRAVAAVLLPLLAAVLLAPGLRSAARRGGMSLVETFHPGLLWPALALCGLAYLGPAGVEEEFGFEDIGQRFSLAGFLLLLGCVRLRHGRAQRVLLAAILAAGVLVKAADLHRVSRVHDRMALALHRLLAELPRHARVLPLFDMAETDRLDLLWHRFGNYAVIERHAYCPHVFARTGQQPLRHRRWGDYRPLARRQVNEAEWRYYDHLLVQSDRVTPEVPGLGQRTRLVARAGDFRLYRIVR